MDALALRQTSEPTPGPLAEVVFYGCDPVEIFRAGTYEGEEYTRDDLDAMVANFSQFFIGGAAPLFAPLVLGHEEELIDNTAVEAAGKVGRLWRDGDTLMAAFTEIPADMAQKLKEGKYRKVSAEIYPEPPPGVPVAGMVLRRVALLGGWPPKVKGLADLPPVVQTYSERTHDGRKLFVVSGPVSAVRLFAEGPTKEIKAMNPEDRAAKEKDLVAKGMSEACVKGMGEDDLKAAHAGMSVKANADPAEPETPAAPEMGRDEMIAALVQKGNDAAALAELSDDELKALMNQPDPASLGEGTDPQGNPKKPESMGAKMHSEPKPADSVKLRAELRLAEHKLAALQKQAGALEAQQVRRFAEERKSRIRTFAERMVADKHVPPAIVGPRFRQLCQELDASTVRTFGEKKHTPLDELMEWFEEAAPVMEFAEKLKGAHQPGKTDAAAEEAKVRKFAEDNVTVLRDMSIKNPDKFIELWKRSGQTAAEFTRTKS